MANPQGTNPFDPFPIPGQPGTGGGGGLAAGRLAAGRPAVTDAQDRRSPVPAPAVAVAVPPVPAKPVRKPRLISKQTVRPNLGAAPAGPPVPVLAAQGYWGSIGEFAERVQVVTDAHERMRGFRPKPDEVFRLATSPVPTHDLPAVVNPPAVRAAEALTPSPRLLKGVFAASVSGTLDEFLERHGPALRLLMRDPKMRAETERALDEAGALDDLYKRTAGQGGPEEIVRAVALAPIRAAKWGYRVERALEADAWDAHEYAQSGGKRGSIEFPRTAEASTAAHQVVTGLVWAIPGLVRLASDVGADVTAAQLRAIEKTTGREAAGRADFSFKGSRRAAREQADFFTQMLAHPEENIGNIALTVFGGASSVAGTGARAGRAGAALRAGQGVRAALGAATAPHPLRTFRLSKGTYGEDIALSVNPLTAYLQERRLIRRQRRLDGEPVGRTLDGTPIDTLAPSDRFGQWAAAVLADSKIGRAYSAEGQIGRAGNIRRQIEYRGLLGLKAELDDAAGAGIRRTRLEPFLPENVARGLTVGEQKALQALSWDDPHPLAAEEAFHQRMIERGIGIASEHKKQIALLQLARGAVENPSPRFLRALDVMGRTVAETERLRLRLGLTVDRAEARVAKAGQVLRGERVLPASREEALARLEKLERAHDAALDEIAAAQWGPIDKAEVARRNLGNAKAARQAAGRTRSGRRSGASGAKARALPTVTAERRARVTEQLAAAVAANPNEPTLRRWVERAEEIDWLREIAYPMPGDPSPIGQPPRRVSPTSWYTPTLRTGKARQRGTAAGPPQRVAGPLGWAQPGGLRELRHQFEGDALKMGDLRVDTTTLVGDGYARTARTVQVLDEWQAAWDAGTPERTSPRDLPIRDVRDAPEHLRRSASDLYDGLVDDPDALALPDTLREWLMPAKVEPHENVKYLDPVLLGDLAKAPVPVGWSAKVMERANNVLRPWIFYFWPRYYLNKLGNRAMLALDQGFLRSGESIAKALAAEDNLSPSALAKLRSLTGQTRSVSYVNPRSGPINSALAEWWSKVTDRDERGASWLYYADRKGYRTWEQVESLLMDETLKRDLVEVTRRSDEALVALDRLSPWEKANLRHLIFVYPWQRGAFLWTFRTVLEHPAKTAILSALGQAAASDDEFLKFAPEWMRRRGYIAFGPGPGGVIVADPTSINTFATMGDAYQTLRAGVTGDRYAALGDLFGPPGQFAVHAALGADENGNQYPGGQWFAAARAVLNTIPPLAAIERNRRGEGEPLAELDIADRASLRKRLNSALRQTVFTPGAFGGFGQLIAGGLTPRGLNLDAAAARYWRDAPAKQRQQREIDLQVRMLALQQTFLEERMPTDDDIDKVLAAPLNDLKANLPRGVWQAVVDGLRLTQAREAFRDENGGDTPTLAERVGITIDYLARAGRITKAETASLHDDARGLTTRPDLLDFEAALLVEHGHARELAAWQERVSTLVALERPEDFAARLDFLTDAGLSERGGEPDARTRAGYGRAYVAYIAERDRLRAAGAEPWELRAFDDSNDQPMPGGMPSLARFRLSEGSTADQRQRLARLASRSWETLTRAEKAAMGRTTPETISEAWAAYDRSLAAVREASGGEVNAEQRQLVAKALDRTYPGFLTDWQYAQKTRAERFAASPMFRALPERTAFRNGVLVPARQIAAAVASSESPGAASDAASKVWRKYVTDKLMPWLRDHPRLAAALEPYGPDFLEGMVTNG